MPQEVATQFMGILQFLQECVPNWVLILAEAFLAASATTLILYGVVRYSRTRIVIGLLLAVAALFLSVVRLR